MIQMDLTQTTVFVDIAKLLQHDHHPHIAVAMKLFVNAMKIEFQSTQKNIMTPGKDKLMEVHFPMAIPKKIKLILKNISPGLCAVWTFKL